MTIENLEVYKNHVLLTTESEKGYGWATRIYAVDRMNVWSTRELKKVHFNGHGFETAQDAVNDSKLWVDQRTTE